MQVTSLEQLKAIKTTAIVNLGEFEDGTPLMAEVKKPNIMNLMANGSIPNSLMNTVMNMFVQGKGQETVNKALNDAKEMQELIKLMEVFAKVCLVNPSYEVLQENGIELTETQMMNIMQFAQGGVKALENFRSE